MSYLLSIRPARERLKTFKTREFRLRTDLSVGIVCRIDGGRYSAAEDEDFATDKDRYLDLGVITRSVRVTEPPEGICSCGGRVSLYPYFMNACLCKNCFQWYSTDGKPLSDPGECGGYPG